MQLLHDRRHALHLLRFLGGQVLLLADVVGNIVKLELGEPCSLGAAGESEN
jgi:hypothetical protein